MAFYDAKPKIYLVHKSATRKLFLYIANMNNYLLKLAYTLIFSVNFITVFAKNDSIIQVVNQYPSEQARIDSAISISNQLMFDDNFNAKKLAKYAFEQSIEHNDYQLGKVYNTLGDAYYLANLFDSSLYYYELGKVQNKGNNNKSQFAESLAGLGLIMETKEDWRKAIEYYIQSYNIREEIKDTSGLASILNNIGLTYYAQEQYDKASEYLEKCIYYDSLLENKSGLGYSYSNLGMIYYQTGNYEKAIKCLQKSLVLREEIGQKMKMAATCNNIANVLQAQKKYKESVEYYKKALSLKKELGNQHEIGITLNNLGNTLSENLNKHQEGLAHLKEAERIFKKEHLLNYQKTNYFYQSQNFKGVNNVDSAYHYLKLAYDLKDSISKLHKDEIIAKLTTEFETEKKEKQIQIQNLKLKQQNSKIEKQDLQQKWMLTLIIGAIVTIIAIVFAFIQKRKDNKLLAIQKEEISEKNEELKQTNEEILSISETIEKQNYILTSQNEHILSSIKYAKRIQEAILPSNEKRLNLLPSSSVWYQAKDIVSGDFYWMEKHNEFILWAAVDCTGHGVPGAFMSILGYNGLNKLVREKNLTKPSEILENLTHHVINSLQQSSTGEGLKDGMDIALCCLNTKTLELQYAGAFNPLYLLRKEDFQITKASRRPIGRFIKDDAPEFANHTFQLHKGDRIYLFTDGIADQFGGETGRKFGYNRMRDILINTKDDSCQAQLDNLKKNVIRWMNEGHEEQIDDICLFAVEV